MLERIKSEGFFKNRAAIIRKAEELGLGKLYVIAPNGGTFLDQDILHLMYSYPQGNMPPLQNRGVFVNSLQDDFQIKTEIKLYNQKALEEQIVISSEEEDVFRAQLSNLIPIEEFSPDELLNTQQVMSLGIPSKEELIQRVFGNTDDEEEDKKEKEQLIYDSLLIALGSSVERTPLLTQERKRRSSSETSCSQTPPSVHDGVDVESRLKKQRTLDLSSMQDKDLEERPIVLASPVLLGVLSSSTFFANSRTSEKEEIVSIDALPLRLKELALSIREEMRKNPQFADAMLAFITEGFANTRQLIPG